MSTISFGPKQFFLLGPKTARFFPLCHNKIFSFATQMSTIIFEPQTIFSIGTQNYYLLENYMYSNCTEECCDHIKKNLGGLQRDFTQNPRTISAMATERREESELKNG